ncbi:MAG: asparagine synthase (glutamine-hydrolyzing) [Thermodesulfobacteriota bacterium]
MNKLFGIFDGERVLGQDSISDKYLKLCVLYEGEIYNSDELRLNLESLGYRFKTGTDSELIAYAYKAWGEECPKKFNGVFSFCIYDKEKEILFLARDQIGKKFLYYTNYNGKFIFSSQVKSIIETPQFHKEIDLRALNYFLAFRNVPDELCIFKNIQKLLPGTVLRFDLKSGIFEKRRYWEPPTFEPEVGNEDTLLEELEEKLLDAIKLRMKGEHSLGAFLSGGVDSSLVVALMNRISSRPVKTFSVGFHENKYSELPYSRFIANYFNTEHKEFVVEPNFDEFLESAYLFDEPLGDPSIFPTYYAGKLAGGIVDAVMTGDGADSLFTGTRTHSQVIRNRRINKFIVPPFNLVLRKVVNLIPEEVKWRIFLENLSPVEFYSKRETVFNCSLRKRLFQDWVLDELNHKLYEPDKQNLTNMDTITGIMTYLELKAHQNSVIPKVEKICRNFSLNSRSPFLDPRLVEFAFGKVPGNMKIRGGVTKYLLKKLAKKFLPPEFLFNRKRGLNPPLTEWFRNEWKNFVRDIIMSDEENFFKKSYIEKLMRLHANPAFDQSRKLFSLLVFKIWEKNYLVGGRI